MSPITKVKDTKSSLITRLFKPMGKSWESDLRTLEMDPRGELVVGVSNSHTMFLGSLVTGALVVPNEPTLTAFHEEMGFLSWHATTLAFGLDTLVVRSGNELQVWSWSRGKLTLTNRSKWETGKKGPIPLANFEGSLHCTSAEIASLVGLAQKPRGNDSVNWKDRVIAVWQRAKLPVAKSLDGNARETRPTRQLALEKEYGDVCFALAEDGTATIAESLEYQKTAMTRWNVAGKRVARAVLDVSVTDLALAGSHVVVTGGDGELLSLDETLAEVKRVKAHRDRAVSVRASNDGGFVVTTSSKELSVFDTASLKRVATLAVKGLHDFRAQSVSERLVLTNNPPRLFALS